MEAPKIEHIEIVKQEESIGERLLERLPEIVDNDTCKRGEELLREVVSRRKQIEDLRKEVTKPIVAAKKNADAIFMRAKEVWEECEERLRERVTEYVVRQREDRERALAEGRHDDAVAIVPVAHVDGVSERVDSEVEVVDPAVIPREFLVPDIAAIKEAIKAGIDVPGVAVREKVTLVVRRKR